MTKGAKKSLDKFACRIFCSVGVEALNPSTPVDFFSIKQDRKGTSFIRVFPNVYTISFQPPR